LFTLLSDLNDREREESVDINVSDDNTYCIRADMADFEGTNGIVDKNTCLYQLNQITEEKKINSSEAEKEHNYNELIKQEYNSTRFISK
jgi:hypothetical protein